MPSILGNNPLLRKDDEPVLTEQDIKAIVESRETNDFMAMTFKVRKTYLKKLRDYAFTNRMEQKEALDKILGEFLGAIDDSTLLEYPEKPKKTRKKGSQQ